MMLEKSKVCSSVIAAVLIISMIISSNTMLVSAKEENTNCSEYIVLTSDNESLDKAVELSEDSEVLMESEDNDVAVSKLSLSAYDVNKLNSVDGVEKIEKDIILSGDSADDTEEDPVLDSLFKDVKTDDINQWNLDSMGVDDVKNNADNKVKVELLDSGVSYSKDIDVKERINLIEEDSGVNPLYEDYSQHGTGMAGAICAKDNGIDVTGVNPNVELYSVRALDDNIEAPLSRIIEGIYWGINNDVDIINMSFGTTTNSGILHTAIREAYESGIVLVAASGNDSADDIQYPAGYAEVISVGSQSPDGEISDFASVGENLDVIAPGEKIESTGIFGTVNGSSGTSIATAQVTGVASLILEKDKTKSPDFVRDLIVASAKKVNDRGIITGAVDCDYALSIYDSFSRDYVEGSPVEYTNPNHIEEYDTDGYVKGLWKSEDHIKMAKETVEDFAPNTNALNLVIKGAIIADKHENEDGNKTGYNFEEVRALHGSGNYVASVKVAAYFIKMMKKYEDIDKAYDLTGDMMINLPAYNNSDSEAELLDDLLATLSFLDVINFSDFKHDGDKYKTNTNETIRFVKYKAAGLCIHIIGDIFAHRAQVPVQAIYNTADNKVKYDPADFKNKYKSPVENPTTQNIIDSAQQGDFFYKDGVEKHIDYRTFYILKRATKLGIVEFRDIRFYSDDYYDPKTKGDISEAYADEPNFYSERFDEAYGACSYLFRNGLSTNFDIYVLLPTKKDEKGNFVKLWNFKAMNKAAGFSNSQMANIDWDSCTSYPLKVDANGNVVRK